MHVLALRVDLHIGHAHSLKDKRGVMRSVIDGARRRFQVAAAEVGHQDDWQRATIAFAAVSGSAGHAEEVIDGVSRFVWSFPELDVVDEERTWME